MTSGTRYKAGAASLAAQRLHPYTRLPDLCAQKRNISAPRRPISRPGRDKFFSESPITPANIFRFRAHSRGRLQHDPQLQPLPLPSKPCLPAGRSRQVPMGRPLARVVDTMPSRSLGHESSLLHLSCHVYLVTCPGRRCGSLAAPRFKGRGCRYARPVYWVNGWSLAHTYTRESA